MENAIPSRAVTVAISLLLATACPGIAPTSARLVPSPSSSANATLLGFTTEKMQAHATTRESAQTAKISLRLPVDVIACAPNANRNENDGKKTWFQHSCALVGTDSRPSAISPDCGSRRCGLRKVGYALCLAFRCPANETKAQAISTVKMEPKSPSTELTRISPTPRITADSCASWSISCAIVYLTLNCSSGAAES